MKLFYDTRDRVAARHGDRRLQWLFEMGACPIDEASPKDEGFLFAGVRPMDVVLASNVRKAKIFQYDHES